MVAYRTQINRPVTDGSTLESLKDPPAKFTVFNINKVCSYGLSSAFGNGIVLANKVDGNRFVTLDDRSLSLALEYVYRKTTAEVVHFQGQNQADKIGVMTDGILYCKSHLMEDQTLRVVGGLEHTIDIQSFTGVNFKVPILDRYSPVALSIAKYLHYEVVKHKGAETTYRISLQYARIMGGRTLLKEIRRDCIICKKLLLKHIQQIMGPLSEHQLTISPIFYYTLIDAWGPLKSYVPEYQKSTRSGSKLHDVYIVVFACAATGMLNVQTMEGGKSVACVLDVLNRFFCESTVPKICYIDKDSALMKVLTEGQMHVVSNDGVVAKQRGITFKTCPAQGHNAQVA